MEDVLSSQVAFNAICVWIIQALKESKYVPWVTAEKTKLLRVISAVTSTLGSAGITYSVVRNAPGDWTFHVGGATLAAVAHFAYHVIFNFVQQKLLYHAVFRGNGAVALGK
jgi:hypothetical protein